MTVRTQIYTRHLSDIWRLPVVEKAYKDSDGRTYLVAHIGNAHIRLTDGDVIAYDTESGEWHTELTTESKRFNGRYPYTTGIKT